MSRDVGPAVSDVADAEPETPRGGHAGPGAAGRSGRRRDLRAAALLALFCFLAFNANMRAISAGDAYPARYLPFGIWRDGTLTLDRLSDVVSQGRRRPFWISEGRGGHLLSLYPVVLPVLVAPLYLPAVAYLNAHGWTDQRLDRVAKVMEKLTASLLASASTALMFLLLRRRTGPRTALLLSLLFAFGTTTWVISSQALWQHGLGQLLLTGALLLLSGSCTLPRAIAAGLLLGLLAGNRPPDAILAAALAVPALFWARRLAPSFLAAAALPALLVLFYNLEMAGHVAGAYGLKGRPKFFRHPLLPGLAGLLASPGRGLFVFSPFLLFVPLGIGRVLRDRRDRVLTLALGAGVLLQLLLYAKADWRAGMSWGPRWLTDLLPALFWMLPPVVDSLGRAGRVLFALVSAASIAIQAVGAFWYAGTSDVPFFSGGTVAEGKRAAWDPRNTPFLVELRHPAAPGDLGLAAVGAVDRLEVAGRTVRDVVAGERAVAVGWALTGGHPPVLATLLVDGSEAGSTSTFSDGNAPESGSAPAGKAGWRIPFETAGLKPGGHTVGAVASAESFGDGHFLGELRFTVTPPPGPSPEPPPAKGSVAASEPTGKGPAGNQPAAKEPPANAKTAGREDLAAAERRAIALVAEHQRPEGYWLTAYTRGTAFERTNPEMNTFVTSTMVDLLDPLAADQGIGATVERARRHLAAQIEPDGLVRYHGLPDAPTIGTLGCAITPDSDDTALVWRIAPGRSEAALKAALGVLESYRTEEGLYRTWLAPREKFHCLDPGKDPNPPDVAIQMHILLFLAKADPGAARALHGALLRAVDEERIWVYYRRTPLVPILRQADLRKAGYPVPLPASRMTTAVPGQAEWIAALVMLDRLRPGGGPPPGRPEVDSLLRSLARDDFAPLRANPPLLFHNDLTATVSRYYWSEDVGYAIWLRLHFENGRRR